MTAPTAPLSDAELAAMRAMLAAISEDEPPFHAAFEAPHGPETCDRCRWQESFSVVTLAAPESMARLLDEVARLQWENEQFFNGLKYIRDNSGMESQEAYRASAAMVLEGAGRNDD